MAHVLRKTKSCEQGQMFPESLKRNNVVPAPPQPGVGYSDEIPLKVGWTEENVD